MSRDRKYDSEDRLDPRKQFDLLRVFPTAFTICTLLLFTSPLVKCIDLAFDTDCSFWMGHAPQVCAFVPLVLISGAHAVHVVRGRPSRLAVVVSLIGSSLVLLVLFMRYMGRGMELGTRFISNDCRTFPSKYKLEGEWQAARAFHEACIEKSGVAHVMIEDCTGYQDDLKKHPEWHYLASLERRHLCGGWCDVGPQLWGFEDTPGVPCSHIVGDVMWAKVERLGTQLFFFFLIVLTITTFVLVYLGPHIRALDVDW